MEKKASKRKFNIQKIIKESAEFYKKELKTKHLWNLVIALFIYFAVLITVSFNIISIEDLTKKYLEGEVDTYLENETSIYENDINTTEGQNTEVNKKTRLDAVKQQLGLAVVTVFVGLTPYVPISVIVTLVYPVVTAITVASHNFFIAFLMTIAVIIEIVFITLLVAIGMYWCKMSTKHFRYSQSTSFTFDDVRLQFNEAMKKDEKVEEIKKKMEQKYEKIKSLNEKTNHKQIMIFTIICVIFLSILTLITGV